MPLHRLDQLLSRCGYCSRTEAKQWIRSGRVLVGETAAESPSQKVPAESVRIDGEPLEDPGGLLAVFHKPSGYVCSHDPGDGPTIYELLPPRWLKRNPTVTSVGRLDKDTTGVLLLTDIGELVQRWTSPKHKVPKVYQVTVDRELSPELIDIFRAGTLVLAGEEAPCAPAQLQIESAFQATLELTEGRYHQVKRMFGSQGFTVTRLHRSRFGEFTVEDLAPGNWRRATVE